MANVVYMSKTGLTGGEATKLDSIDGAGLTLGDVAFVTVSNVQYIYKWAASVAAESSPDVIAADANGGDNRWLLQGLYGTTENGLTLAPLATGFEISGGTTSKKLTVEADSLVNQDLTSDASPTHAGLTLSGLTASLPVFTDGAKKLESKSVENTRTALGLGTGDSPTLTGLTASGLTASLPVFTSAAKALESKSVVDAQSALAIPAEGAWTNYGATSSIVGWSTFGAKELYYKIVGKIAFVTFRIGGISNSTESSFTIPHTLSLNISFIYRGALGSTEVFSMGHLYGSKVTCYNGGHGTVWPDSGNKYIYGQLFYPIP